MTDDEKYCIDRYGKRAIASYTWSHVYKKGVLVVKLEDKEKP